MMKKNLFYIFALMFSFIVLSSANVLAINASWGDQINGTATNQQETLVLIRTSDPNSNLSQYRLNITIDLTHIKSGQHSLLLNTSISQIRITLPSQLVYKWTANNNHTAHITGNGTSLTTANFTNTSRQILLWTNSSAGPNSMNFLNGSAGLPENVLSNASIAFNVTALSYIKGETINISVLYNDSTTAYNTSTVLVDVLDRFNSTNKTTLTFNEDVNTQIILEINNTNQGTYPGDNVTLKHGFIRGINITLSSHQLVLAGNSTNLTELFTASSQTLATFEKYNNTNFGWVPSNNSNQNMTLMNSSNVSKFFFSVLATQPGNYSIYVTIYGNGTDSTTATFSDTLGVRASTIYDTTAPTNFTYSCTPTSIYQGETLSCPCSAVDNYYVSGGSGLNISVATLEIQATGTYSPVCTALDGNGNSATATSSYTVNSQTSSSTTTSGAGGGYSGSTTHNVNSLSATESRIITSESQENLKFKTTSGTTSGTTFKGTIDTIGNDSVTLTLVLSSGLNKELTISSGSTGKVDLDEDGTYDLSVTLSGISSGVATLAMKEISETVPVEAAGGEEETETITGEEKETTKAKEPKKNLTWLWTTLVAIAVIAVVIFYLTQKKGPVGVFFITLFSKNSGRSFRKKK